MGRRERRKKAASQHPILNPIIAVGFSVALIAFSAVNVFKPTRDFSENENRVLQKFPSISWEEIESGVFGTNFDKYVSDQFLGRDVMVSAKAVMEKLSGKKENKGAYFGEDGYLIQTAPTPNEQYIENNIQAVKDLASLGKYQVTMMLVPTAYEIMQDKLPAYAYEPVERDLINRVEQELQGSGAKFVDPSAALRDNDGRQVYYRTDHHWTSFGAYKGYVALADTLGYTPMAEDEFNIETLSDSFYGTTWSKATLPDQQPDTIEAYVPKEEVTYSVEFVGENATMDSLYSTERLKSKDKYSVFLDGNHSFEIIHSSVANGKSLFVIKDSYAHALVPFLANHYENIYMLDLRYYNGDPQKLMDQYGVTDVLFVYNCQNYVEDNNMVKISAFIEE